MTWVVKILLGQNEAIIGECFSNSSRGNLLFFFSFLHWFQTDTTRGNLFGSSSTPFLQWQFGMCINDDSLLKSFLFLH